MKQTAKDYVRNHCLATAWSTPSMPGNVADTVKQLKSRGYSAKETMEGAKLPNVYWTPSMRPCTVGKTVALLHDAGYEILEVSRATEIAMCIAVKSSSPYSEREIVDFFKEAGYSDREIIGEFNRPFLTTSYVPDGIEKKL